MSSQGQRFRRRALRRGYKVDEVDTFLDRVEATLAGEAVGPPVGAQEVHDVVFRVRFGGYDEWQVDLHLDRVERQLAELEDRGGRPPAPDPMRDSLRGGLTAGMTGASMGGAGMGGAGMTGAGMTGPAGMSGPGMAGQGGMAAQGMGGPGMGGPGMGGPGMGGPGMGAPARMAPPTERLPAPMPQRPQAQQPDPYGRYEEPYGPAQSAPQMPPRGMPPGYDQGGYDQGYDQGSYDGFEAGRHGKADMTAEMRMPHHEQEMRGYGGPAPMSGPPTGGSPMGGAQLGGSPMTGRPMSGPPMNNAPMNNPAMNNPAMNNPAMNNPAVNNPAMNNPAMGGPPMNGPGMAAPPMSGAPMSGAPATGGYGPAQPQLPPLMGQPGGELHRVDQLRRTFQPRRFGSGYDPMQVDRLFEGILQALSGRGPMPVPENELDMLQFGLVPGGYFEAEVDAALREVKDILLRRR